MTATSKATRVDAARRLGDARAGPRLLLVSAHSIVEFYDKWIRRYYIEAVRPIQSPDGNGRILR
jgi:hypothetical protein